MATLQELAKRRQELEKIASGSGRKSQLDAAKSELSQVVKNINSIQRQNEKISPQGVLKAAQNDITSAGYKKGEVFFNKSTQQFTDKYGQPVISKKGVGKGSIINPTAEQVASGQSQVPLKDTLRSSLLKSTAQVATNLPALKSGQTTPQGLQNVRSSESTPYGSTTPYAQTIGMAERAAPTVATPENPLVTIGGEKSVVTPTTDSQRMIEIGLKQYKGEALTDEDIRYLLEQQMKPAQTPDIAPVQAEITAQQNQIQSQIEQRQAEQAKTREQLLGEQRALTQSQLQEQSGIIQRGADMEIQAGQNVYSFKGFGRSTSSANNAQMIQENANREIANLQKAANLQEQLFLKELQSADEAELQPLRDQINGLQEQSRQLTIDNLRNVAEANAKSGVTALEALSNLMEVLPKSTQPKVNTQVSEMLGYMADDFGNPIGTDMDGNPIALPSEGVKYEKYTDEVTGKTYFYNPYDPTDSFAAPSNTMSIFTDNYGNPSSSSSSNTAGLQDATQQVAEIFGEEPLKYGANCVFFARSIVPNIPTGATSVQGRIDGITRAQKRGFGGTDMDFVQVGDAIHTTEGSVGHTAVVVGREGDNLILLEANYRSGQITSGRVINKNDPSILGWIRGENVPAQNIPTEGLNPGIEQAIVTQTFDPAMNARFKKYAKDVIPPTFRGTDFQKAAQEQEFYSNYNLWASMPENQEIIGDINRTEKQRDAKTYAEMMNASNQILNNQDSTISGMNRIGFHLQAKLPPYLWGPKYRSYFQAAAEFINAIGRKQSGAQISAQEWENYFALYGVTPGDSPAQIKQKQDSRQRAIDTISAEAGYGYAPKQPQSLLQQLPQATQSGRVLIQDAEGNQFTIPSSQIQEAIDSGYTLIQ